MNDVTITLSDGTVTVLTQEDIVSPKFDCDCYYGQRPEDYVIRISEMGIVTVTNNPDGSHTYNKISSHCICNVEFTPDCS